MICSLIHLHDTKGHVVSINASQITYIYDFGPTRSIRVGSNATWAVSESHEEIISMINALEDEDEEPEVIKLGGPLPAELDSLIQAAVEPIRAVKAAKAASNIDEVTPF